MLSTTLCENSSLQLLEAKHFALAHYRERLDKAVAAATIDGREVLRTLGHCEQFFENEHRKWLRLMLTSDWFA